MIGSLSYLTGGLYLFATLSYLMRLIFSERKMGRIGLALLWLGVLVHTLLMFVQLHRNPYPFILGEGDFYLCTSWGMAIAFLILRARYRLSGSGALFAPLTLLLFLLASVHRGEYDLQTAALRNPWVLIHLVFMSLAFAVFTVSFLVGLTYLFAERQIKMRRFGRWTEWLPSLHAMDNIHYKALTVGFILLSVGILSGAALSKATIGHFFSGDHRQLAAIGTWGLYAVFLNIRMKSGWRGRKGILLSILGFIGVVLAFIALEHRVS